MKPTIPLVQSNLNQAEIDAALTESDFSKLSLDQLNHRVKALLLLIDIWKGYVDDHQKNKDTLKHFVDDFKDVSAFIIKSSEDALAKE